MNCQMNMKTWIIAASAVGTVTLAGIVAACIWNSKQMKAARAIKRASRVMYHVGTAMRNLSGETAQL